MMSTAITDQPDNAAAAGKPAHDWDSYYRRTLELPFPERYTPFLEKLPQGGTVLDFGCGSGRFTLAFHRDRPDLIIDVLDQHLSQAALLENADWIRRRMPIAFQDFHAHEAYDGIWAHAVLFFPPAGQLAGILSALSHALKPGGTLYFTFVRPTPEAQAMHVHGLEQAELEKNLHQAKLQIESMEYRDMKYGKAQTRIPTMIVHARKT